MDLLAIGQRIRKQREAFGYTRDTLSELLDITPRFCADIELGVKGMSVQTLINISRTLRLPTDYILFGTSQREPPDSLALMLQSCEPKLLPHIEQLLRTFLAAVDR
ncbi:MAG: helix-turn-helix domain-containing protein [Oscillospiraceae bacterium]|jgi:transcriptional regulator with XRE-family HTH domain|nr:helix-turn-helix domain-containing protein [Oscillospiraceae bacterium]